MLPPNFRYDKKTGRKRRVDLKRSRKAKLAARKRRGKHLKASTKMKIRRSLAKTNRTGRTQGGKGRRVIKKTLWARKR